MFVLFGRKSKVKTVRGGRRVEAECPSCGVTAQFHECEKESSLNLYVVLDLFSEKSTVFRCTSCGDVFELDEQATAAARQREDAQTRSQSSASAAAETPRQRARREREERRQAERLRQEKERDAAAREILRQRKQERKQQQIEDELAALKRKLHKD